MSDELATASTLATAANAAAAPADGARAAMRLRALRSDGYRLFRSIDIVFPDGVIGLLGRNGSGKTSLLESITFALYGSGALRTAGTSLTKEDILPPDGGDANIEFEFDLGDRHYRIERQMAARNAGQKAKLWRDDNPEPIANGPDAVSAEVTALIGGRAELEISRFVGQKQVDALSQKDPAPRKQLILKLIGIEEIDAGLKALREQRTDFDRTIKARQAILPNITDINAAIAATEAELTQRGLAELAAQEALSSVEAERDRREAALAALEANAEEAAGVATTLKYFAEQLEEHQRDLDSLAERERSFAGAAEQLVTVEAAIARAEANHAEYLAAEEAAALRGKLSEMRATAATLDGEINTARARVAELTAAAAAADKLNTEQERLEQRAARLENEHAQAEAQRNSCRTDLLRCRTEAAELADQLALLTRSETTHRCPTCEQELADPAAFRTHLEQRREALLAQEQELTSAGTAAKERSERIVAEMGVARSRLSEVAAGLLIAAGAAGELRLAAGKVEELVADRERVAAQIAEAEAVPYDEERHVFLAGEAAGLSDLLTQRAKLSGQLLSSNQTADDRAKVLAAITSLRTKQEDALSTAAAAGYDPEGHEAARVGAAAARQAVEDAVVALNRERNEQARIGDRLARERADAANHARLVAEIESILSDRGLIELTRETMERFKINLIGRIQPALARKASVLLREMTEGRYSELVLDEDYEISIGNAGSLRPVRGVSGGESDLANLCLRLAISEMITERAGIGSSFVVLDEVLGSQDPERAEAIMGSMPNLLGHFSQILMVSHDPGVQDRFSSAITVRFDPVSERSTVRYPEVASVVADAEEAG